jgi:hypothetical protein
MQEKPYCISAAYQNANLQMLERSERLKNSQEVLAVCILTIASREAKALQSRIVGKQCLLTCDTLANKIHVSEDGKSPTPMLVKKRRPCSAMVIFSI